ncbi:MAG: protein disulfide oxidoreductase [Myxococcales bacterium]
MVNKARLKTYALQGLLFIGLLYAVHLYKTRNHTGETAPMVLGHLLDGGSAQLGGQHEGPVLLHFWATWCGVCSLEEGSIEALSRDVRVISVASRSGSDQDVRKHMRSRGLTFPVINDPSGAIARAYGVREYPSSFFVTRQGSVATSEVGYTTSLGLRLRLWYAGFW